MNSQNQIGSMSLNPLSAPTNRMPADVRTSSAGGGDEHPLKVRKPYTITKQRERWAEEEHKKFLEALQLYGRAWRRIEEHIGTKTAVQIRSHAQKFFSKVVRESGTDGNVKSIEIPPPRPKRKPAHPYPRKLGNGGLSISKLERSLSPVKSGFEQENGSPTSVLTGVGSDTLGSLLSNLPSRCESPVTSAAGSNEQDASVEEENNPQLPSQTAMELDISSEDHAPLKKEEQVPYLKLFGTTVLVTDSNKPSSPPSVGNTTQVPNQLPTLGFAGSQERSANMDLGAPSQNFAQGVCSGDFSLGLGKSNWSPWSGGVFPMFYPLQSSNFGDITNPADARIIPMPWWGMYGNLHSFPFNHQHDENSRQAMSQSFAEPSSEKEQRKECSWTDSNTADANEGGNSVSSQSAVKHHRNMDTDDSSLLRSPRARSDASMRGFVPYKRCLIEKEAQQHSHGVADDGEGQSIGLCL